MKTSANENTPGVFPINKTYGVHCCISLISLNHKICILYFKTEDTEGAFQIKAEEDSVNKDHGIRMQIVKETVSRKVMYKWKTIESGLAR